MTLRSRFNNKYKNSSLNVALIGAGQMGQGIVSQLSKQEAIHLSYIVDRNIEKAKEAQKRYEQNKENSPIISIEISSINLDDVDIVIEATGSPITGAVVADFVLNNGIDLILLNVETEATIGLELRRIAEKNNCILTVGHGDEPTAAMELYNFAIDLSFDVISIGKGKNNIFNQFAVPSDLKIEARQKRMNPKMLTSFVDGTKTMVEMTALANAIDFTVDKDGMHGPESTYDQLSNIFIPREDGGILSSKGVVDFAFGIAPGVFTIIYSEDDYVNYEMEYLKMGRGPYWTLYRPYHLTSLEIPRTIFHLSMNRETILSANVWNVYVAAYAKKDMKPGEQLDSIGGICYFGVSTNKNKNPGYLPVGIAEKSTIIKPVMKGDPIYLEQVEIDQNTIYKMWKEQEENLE